MEQSGRAHLRLGGLTTPDPASWGAGGRRKPGYADRDQLREQLETYARDAIEAGREADYLAETELAPFDAALVGIND
uniref:hypothetical protein n=1 Tax=Nocardia abscessus TaxID=120957 RepID=UPI00245684F3